MGISADVVELDRNTRPTLLLLLSSLASIEGVPMVQVDSQSYSNPAIAHNHSKELVG